MGIPAVIEGTLERLPGAHRALVRLALRRRRRGAPDRRRARGRGGRRPVSWILAFAGFALADHPPRARPLHRRQGGRDARRALLALLRPHAAALAARGDRVRRRLAAARRLREDHRHEPGGGDPAGGRPPRLLPPAGVEADRGDPRRADGQHRARVPDPAGALLGDDRRPARGQGRRTGSRPITKDTPAAGVLQQGDRILAVDGKTRRPGRAAQADRLAHVRGRAGATAAGPPSRPCWSSSAATRA